MFKEKLMKQNYLPLYILAAHFASLVGIYFYNPSSVISGDNPAFYFALGSFSFFSLLFTWWMGTNVKNINRNIGSILFNIDNVAGKLRSSGELLSKGTAQTASNLEENVASLEELTCMVVKNTENAKEAVSVSNDSENFAKEGKQKIEELIGSMQEITESSQKMEEIINVIDEISFQTNLLALNAAVEAARAGEHGKGFAVVADAVRTLAGRSSSAAKDITSLIQDSVKKIEKGAVMANRSGEVLKEIVVSIQQVAQLNDEIATASEEQSLGITQINASMNEIDQATQRNAVAAEELTVTVDGLKKQGGVFTVSADASFVDLSKQKANVLKFENEPPAVSDYKEENKEETPKVSNFDEF